jgi:hypothetical protein
MIFYVFFDDNNRICFCKELVIRPIATDLRKNAVALAEFEIDELIKENESPGSKHKKTHKSLIPEQQQQQE